MTAQINSNWFVNTQWKYSYTTDAESNELLYRAADGYQHFIYFKYDSVAQTYLNGDLSKSPWKIKATDSLLNYAFAGIQEWKIAELSHHSLVLEFSIDSKPYRYYFVAAKTEETPFFTLESWELPEVLVSKYYKGEAPHKFRHIKDEKGKRQQYSKRSERLQQAREDSLRNRVEPEFLQIELVGGGFFGGVDPVYRNHLTIKTDGRIIKEMQTENAGLRVWKSNISRHHLEKLVEFIEKHHFFEFENIYSCKTSVCMDRMGKSPRPIALRLAVTKGLVRKVITVSIYEGWDQPNHWISYPKDLDEIIRTIEQITMTAISQ